MGFFDFLLGKKTGGTKDAFKGFLDFSGAINPFIDKQLKRLFQQGRNPLLGEIGRPFGKAQQAINQIGGEQDNIRGIARNTAVGINNAARQSTNLARQDAVRAARLSAGGRGGLAFGGGAGALASLGASSAAAQQGGAIANARVAGGQLKIQSLFGIEQLNTQRAGLQSQLAGAQSNAALAQASLIEKFRDRIRDSENLRIKGQFGLAQTALGTGLAGNQAASGRRSGFLSGLFG